jgi:hypothetical protein
MKNITLTTIALLTTCTISTLAQEIQVKPFKLQHDSSLPGRKFKLLNPEKNATDLFGFSKTSTSTPTITAKKHFPVSERRAWALSKTELPLHPTPGSYMNPETKALAKIGEVFSENKSVVILKKNNDLYLENKTTQKEASISHYITEYLEKHYLKDYFDKACMATYMNIGIALPKDIRQCIMNQYLDKDIVFNAINAIEFMKEMKQLAPTTTKWLFNVFLSTDETKMEITAYLPKREILGVEEGWITVYGYTISFDKTAWNDLINYTNENLN